MGWLLAQQIRPFITLAALASLLLNLAMLAPALYMLQVFDRVFASGSIETLIMLSVPVLLMLVFGLLHGCGARAHARGRGSARRSHASRRPPLAASCTIPPPARAANDDALRDVAQLRKLLASPASSRCSTRRGCRSIC